VENKIKKFNSKEYYKQWCLKNKEKLQQWHREFYLENREAILKDLKEKRKNK
jgi:hypothetical protein